MKHRTIILALLIQTFYVHGQLVNGDFEDINTNGNGFQKPENWNFGVWNNNNGSEITTDSYSGNYAVKLWSWYFVQSNVEFYYGEAFNKGDTITDRPNKLKGYYKFENPNIQFNVPDSALVQISLTRYNFLTNKRDTIAFTQTNLGEQNNYSEFEVEFNYLDTQMPDSIQIMFRTSYFQGPSDNTNENNFLYLDNLSLDYSTTSVDEKAQNTIAIFPNPTKNIIHISAAHHIGKINIYTITGSLLASKIPKGSEKQYSYDVSHWPRGIFFLEIIGVDDKVVDRIKIVKQ